MSNGTGATPAPSTRKYKLFLLSVWKSVKVLDNAALLWADIDRGWVLDCYETILSDPSVVTCHVLVRLYTDNPALPATPPSGPITPAPVPPGTIRRKLFVLKVYQDSDILDNTSMSFLSMELDRGWTLDCYEKIAEDPATGFCCTLVRLTTDQPSDKVPAVPPAPPAS